jgi:hypothetical protein
MVSAKSGKCIMCIDNILPERETEPPTICRSTRPWAPPRNNPRPSFSGGRGGDSDLIIYVPVQPDVTLINRTRTFNLCVRCRMSAR